MFAVKATSQAYYIFHLRRIVDPGEREVIVFSFGFLVHDMTVHFRSYSHVYSFCFVVFLATLFDNNPKLYIWLFSTVGQTLLFETLPNIQLYFFNRNLIMSTKFVLPTFEN